MGLIVRKLQEEIALKDELLAELDLKSKAYGQWREEENFEIIEDEKRKK